MMPPPFPTRFRSSAVLAALVLAVATLTARQQPPAPPPAAPLQQNEVSTTITGDQTGDRPRLAVPDCIALATDNETVDAAKTIGRVLWDDLDFEREFALIPRDVAATVPAATSLETVPFDRWRELNTDG